MIREDDGTVKIVAPSLAIAQQYLHALQFTLPDAAQAVDASSVVPLAISVQPFGPGPDNEVVSGAQYTASADVTVTEFNDPPVVAEIDADFPDNAQALLGNALDFQSSDVDGGLPGTYTLVVDVQYDPDDTNSYSCDANPFTGVITCSGGNNGGFEEIAPPASDWTVDRSAYEDTSLPPEERVIRYTYNTLIAPDAAKAALNSLTVQSKDLLGADTGTQIFVDVQLKDGASVVSATEFALTNRGDSIPVAPPYSERTGRRLRAGNPYSATTPFRFVPKGSTPEPAGAPHT